MKKIIFYFDTSATKMLVKYKDESGEARVRVSSVKNFVSRGEIVARVVQLPDDDLIETKIDPGYKYYNAVNHFPLKIDQGIYYDEISGAYKADNYGFVVLVQGKLTLLNAYTVTPDKLRVYYTVCPTKFHKLLEVSDINEDLRNAKIIGGVDPARIEEQLKKIDPQRPQISRILVANGKPPVNGYEEYFEPLVDVEKKAGKIQADGSIDFKEIGAIIQVEKNQAILRREPDVKPEDGYDVYGDRIKAETLARQGYKKGDGFVESGEDRNIFLAEIDGCIKIWKGRISVYPTVIIHGDVNYETGNVDFNGSVHVRGSVLAGFQVKATADITVENIVEDALIEAGGNITVKMGVVGKESVKLVAGGSISAKYLLNARVEAGRDITVEDSIINCEIFSNNKISVVAKQGKIIGGTAIAFYEIEVNVAGAPNETATNLAVGRNLIIEKELSSVQREIAKAKDIIDEIMRKLRAAYGEGIFENPAELLKVLPEVKRKNCILLLKELSVNNTGLKELNEKYASVQAKFDMEKEPVIIIKDRIYPGVVLNIKKSVRKIDRQHRNVKFYEDPDEKMIRFVPAV